MLHSPRLEDHMKTIGIDKSLCNRSSFEHKCLDNIKKIYHYAGKCDKQQNPKDILDASMLSTFRGRQILQSWFSYDINTSQKSSAGKSLCLFTNVFDV